MEPTPGENRASQRVVPNYVTYLSSLRPIQGRHLIPRSSRSEAHCSVGVEGVGGVEGVEGVGWGREVRQSPIP